MKPKVSFVIPCYKLAHYLPECIHSILTQTYQDFEILIMDDCSPDNTPQVAHSFTDPRVRYIRNEPNIGHVPNFNKGIALSRGEYVWLISADDFLRRPYILERYMEVMEAHPEIGYACCPAMELLDGKETQVSDYSVVADTDKIFKGREFLTLLRDSDRVICAAGMVRKACYDQLGDFPLDLPYAGDWYLWCLFALHFDVAYFAEPMVYYRIHQASMNSSLDNGAARSCTEYCVEFHCRIAEKAEEKGDHEMAEIYRAGIIGDYARGLSYGSDAVPSSYRQEDFDASLKEHVADPRQQKEFRRRVHEATADRHFAQKNPRRAAESYAMALKECPWLWKARAKSWLLRTGSTGAAIRQLLARPVRRMKQFAGNGARV